MYFPRLILFLVLLSGLRVGATPPDERDHWRRQQETVLQTALSFIGTPYLWGGNTERGIDCSGLMVQSFRAIQVSLPRHSGDQAQVGYPVAFSQLQRGDMVFFAKKGKVFHVGLLMRREGEEMWFIHASSSRGVIVSRLSQKGWKHRYHGARRMWKVATPGPGLDPNTPERLYGGEPAYLKLPLLAVSERRLSRAEAFAMGPRNRRKAQADILARYGYRFPGFPEIQAHYEGFDWYREQLRIDYAEVIFELLTPIERHNLRLFSTFER
jgi:probable lipoprotein NlpC